MVNQEIEILVNIRQQLIDRGELTLANKQYLISAVDLIEAGEPIEAAFTKAEYPEIKNGKQSANYQDTKRAMEIRLGIAFTYMTAQSNWGKCEQLAALGRRISRATKPANEPEKILLRIIESGIRIPTTTRAIYRLISKNH